MLWTSCQNFSQIRQLKTEKLSFKKIVQTRKIMTLGAQNLARITQKLESWRLTGKLTSPPVAPKPMTQGLEEGS